MKIGKIPQYIKLYWQLVTYKSQDHYYNGEVDVFDTALKSDNLGDEIINYYCNEIFKELGVRIEARVPTHVKPTMEEEKKLKPQTPKIVTGTNILSSKLEAPFLWRKPSLPAMFDNVVLMGNGWEMYTNKETVYSKIFYKKMLDNNFYHSVRDSYTLNKLKKLGVNKVLNTSCPTTWRLTPELCKTIPTKKARNVITTITDYSQDLDNDGYMLDVLLKEYENVYIWIQGENDMDYIKKYPNYHKLKFVGRSLKEYNNILDNSDLDYVGTRLHAGIHALNKRKRSIIVSIDNRARELGKDINLTLIERENLKTGLKKLINSDFKTEISLPIKNIEIWKNQFKVQ